CPDPECSYRAAWQQPTPDRPFAMDPTRQSDSKSAQRRRSGATAGSGCKLDCQHRTAESLRTFDPDRSGCATRESERGRVTALSESPAAVVANLTSPDVALPVETPAQGERFFLLL